MVYDPVEDGLGPGGRPAQLFQHHGRHASDPRPADYILLFVDMPCRACTWSFRLGQAPVAHVEIQVDSVDLHI